MKTQFYNTEYVFERESEWPQSAHIRDTYFIETVHIDPHHTIVDDQNNEQNDGQDEKQNGEKKT